MHHFSMIQEYLTHQLENLVHNFGIMKVFLFLLQRNTYNWMREEGRGVRLRLQRGRARTWQGGESLTLNPYIYRICMLFSGRENRLFNEFLFNDPCH